jgi:DNA-binding MarR family transcriptional regulator
MFLLVQQMTKRFQEVLEPHNITPLHWGVLCCLWSEDGLRTTEIAQRLEQLGGTITVGLDAMESRRLIRRRQDPSDRRVSRVFLTAKARDLQTKLVPAAQSLIAELFAGLSAAEYQDLFQRIVSLRQQIAQAPGSQNIRQENLDVL